MESAIQLARARTYLPGVLKKKGFNYLNLINQ